MKKLLMVFLSFPADVHTLVPQLRTDTSPHWGQMSAQHMLEHLIVVTKLSYGAIRGKVLTPETEWESRKSFLHNDAPFSQNIINPALPKDPLPLRYPSFELAQQKLLKELDLFDIFWQENPDHILPHPIFGPLNKSEWLLFHKKHFTHHLAQFGLKQ